MRNPDPQDAEFRVDMKTVHPKPSSCGSGFLIIIENLFC